jgi:hypothetical protein
MILIGLDHKVTRFGRKRFILWRGRKLLDTPQMLQFHPKWTKYPLGCPMF